jgi:hypothetical protein
MNAILNSPMLSLINTHRLTDEKKTSPEAKRVEKYYL